MATPARSGATPYRALSEAPRNQLATGDLERLAVAAFLIGEDDEAVAGWEQAHRRHLEAGEQAEAARCAFGPPSFDDAGTAGARRGWLLRGVAMHSVTTSTVQHRATCLSRSSSARSSPDDAAGARQLALQAGEIAARFGDADLAAFSTLAHGQALLAGGREGCPAGRSDAGGELR